MSEMVSMTGRAIRWLWTADDQTARLALFVPDQIPACSADGWSEAAVSEAGKIKVMGDFGDTRISERVEIWGKWTFHPRHGWGFKLNTVLPDEAITVDAIVAFLAGADVKNIGPEMANRVAAHFGEDLPRIMLEEPMRLCEVDGIGEARAESITEAWNEKAGLRRVFSFFAAYGVSGSVSRRAYTHFGVHVINVVKEDPFGLLDVRGFGFSTVEGIARAIGVEPWSVPYVKGALWHVCDDLVTRRGHTAVYKSAAQSVTVDLVRETLQKAGLSSKPPADIAGIFRQAYVDLIESGRVSEVVVPGGVATIHVRYGEAEAGIASRLSLEKVHASKWPRFQLIPPEEALASVEEDMEIELSAEQRSAVMAALTYPVSIVTGGPGTGKTTILYSATAAADRMGLSVGLCAPTGKAAKRMEEVTGRPAMTVHRLLEFSPRQGGFQYGAYARSEFDTPYLHYDLVVVDEASMLDVELAYAVFSAVKPGAHLLIVGDVYQLPSVGPGNVLFDLLDSAQMPSTMLTRIFRQGEGSGIVAAALDVLDGKIPSPAPDFEIHDLPAMGDVVDRYLALPREMGCALEDVQVIIPNYRGDYGIDAFNAEVQRRLTAMNPPLRDNDKPIYVGDRVIQLKNDYALGVVNGDVGYVRSVDGGSAVIEFDGVGFIEYSRANALNLAPAYAVSVHKTQGSEFMACIVLLHRSHFGNLQRNVLYTALTRAKSKCVLYSALQSLRKSVTTLDQELRLTTLPKWMASPEDAVDYLNVSD